MKTVNKDELFQNLSGFLKSKGIELQDGSYTHRIRQGCNLLSEIVNATQETAERAKVKLTKKVEEVRQTIHKATAPKPAPAPSGSEPPVAPAPKSPAADKHAKIKKRRPTAKGLPSKRRGKK